MSGGFRVRSTTRVADTGFLALDRVELETADGTAFDRTVVRHPGAVVVVPVLDGDTAVLVRQYRVAVGHDLLEVPAGKRDVDGEDPATTAARELEEEIGYRPGRLVKLAEFWNTPGFCDEYSHVYLALDLEQVDVPAPTSPEEAAMTVERVPLADIDARIARRELADAKSIIGLLLARAHLRGEHPALED